MSLRRWILAAGAGAVTLAGWACGDAALPVEPGVHQAPPATASPSALLDDGLFGGLLSCTPLPADSVTQIVGPLGGVIRVGPHRLNIPSGALADPVAITAILTPDTVNQVQFLPEGLTFARPATLNMSYANCGVVTWLLPKRIAHVSDLLSILEYVTSWDLPLLQRVRGQLEHFSRYAVAW